MATRCGWLVGCLLCLASLLSLAAAADADEAADQAVAEAEQPVTVAGRELAGWVADLKNEQRVVRLRAARSLASFGNAPGEALRSALESEDPAVRYLAAVDLGRLGGAPLLAALERLTLLRADQEHPAVQMAAAFALCRSGNAEGNLSLLVDRLASPERAMVCSAAELLELLETLGPLAAEIAPAAEVAAALEKARQRDWDTHEDSSKKTAHDSPGEPSTIAAQHEFPNILWIVGEGLSPDLGCYGDPHAKTPHLDHLAAEGARFERAFTPAGSGGVVRSGVITGMYPPSIGSQHMRSRIVPPPEVRCFSEYFRAAGYYCTNRGATDYQFESPLTAWDRQGESHGDWRERGDPAQPFFAVVNLTSSPADTDPAASDSAKSPIAKSPIEREPAIALDPQVPADRIPPFYSATAETRQEWARYRERIVGIDRQVGELLARLAEDGLAENTLVVFCSDSGRGLPAGASWLCGSATRIPMIIRWPANIAAGSVREDLVSVLDLPPTMFAAAKLRGPKSLQGRRLFGDTSDPEPAYLFFHRDRVGPTYDLQRGARDRRWKYVRNYEPAKPYTAHPWLSKTKGAEKDVVEDAANDAAKEGPPVRSKPIEELYDCQNDRWEAENLAELPQYAERLARMREAVEQWQQEIGDLGMLPEAVMMHEQRPGGELAETAPPVIRRTGDAVLIYCPTEGASIAYRTGDGEEWSQWKLYVDAFVLGKEERLEAKAVRLGYRESKIITN